MVSDSHHPLIIYLNKRMKKNKIYYIIIVLGSFFYGCATIPEQSVVKPNIPGFYHRLEQGQTLWRISKIYNVDLDELIKINKISDVTQVQKGRFIFIPKEKKQLPKNVIIEREQTQELTKEDFIWPLKGTVVSHFGEKKNNIANKGIDIKPKNNYNIMNTRKGEVVFLNENLNGYGKTIIIDHYDGLSSVYASYDMEFLVKLGDRILQDTPIAKLNQTSSNPILHFEIRKKSKPQNPSYYLP